MRCSCKKRGLQCLSDMESPKVSAVQMLPKQLLTMTVLLKRIFIEQVCPQLYGKSAALLRLLATPTPRTKPARLARPKCLQF